jgi:hypothetical protein
MISYRISGSVTSHQERGLIADVSLESDDRWQLAKRISVSPAFFRSPRLAHLLLYLCEQAVLDRKSLLTEQNLAHAVFERKGNFDPAADTIVRSQMVRLRQRLEAYFREEGCSERIRISIPRGGYVPVFEEVLLPPVETEDTITAPLPVTSHEPDIPGRTDQDGSHGTTWRLRAVCGLLSILCIVLGSLLFIGRPATPSGARESPYAHRFWKRLFDRKAGTKIVAADSGIVMLHGGTGQNTNLSEYLSRNFSKELAFVSAERQKELLFDASRRYTSFVDLEFFDRLTHLPEAVNGGYAIRFARDISVNDLKNGNIILSGSQDANPWLELFEPQMNFVLHNDLTHGVRAFSNRNPRSGENSIYAVSQDEYGVLAFLPNLSRTGNVLIVEGTSVAGTQAISDFLFMGDDLDQFLRKISRSDGSIPAFEILLESHPLADSASRSQIVAYRTY